MIRWLAVLGFIACGSSPRDPPPAPAPPPALSATIAAIATVATVAPPASFQPTSFGVDVTGRGRPIIFIPGLGCPASVWDETVAHFGGHIEAHVLTLAGFAGRPAIDAPLLATVRGELARYIRDRKLDHPVIIGHSLGGFLAYWLAATAPDLVGPVVVVDIAPVIFGTIAPPGGKDNDPWRNASDAEFAAKVRELFAPMATSPARIEPVIAAVTRSDKRAFAGALDDLRSIDIRAELPHIRASTLIVLADDRDYLDLVTKQVAAIPKHEVVMLANTKHFVFFDDPAAFFRTLDEFLAR